MDGLFVVAVHVPEPHVEGAVRVDVEPFVDRSHRLTRPVAQVHELRRVLRAKRNRRRQSGRESKCGFHGEILAALAARARTRRAGSAWWARWARWAKWAG